jgi:hypothetical protein
VSFVWYLKQYHDKTFATSKGLGDATIFLHWFSAELRKAQKKKATWDGRITNFFQRVKHP